MVHFLENKRTASNMVIHTETPQDRAHTNNDVIGYKNNSKEKLFELKGEN